jgi:hypothetical protein
MNPGGNYIKNVEEYFISLAGEGIMLSSIDYDLIRGWRDGGIPEEIVMRGISRAFGDKGRKAMPGGSIRGLRQCAEFIKTCAEEYGYRSSSGRGDVTEAEAGRGADPELSITERLGRLIESEKRDAVRKYYSGLRARILKSEGGDELPLSRLIGEAMDEFFASLPDKEREKIEAEARGKLGERARLMTEKAYAESLVSFRNEILSKKYSIESVV